jgi:hypothetical protein
MEAESILLSPGIQHCERAPFALAAENSATSLSIAFKSIVSPLRALIVGVSRIRKRGVVGTLYHYDQTDRRQVA